MSLTVCYLDDKKATEVDWIFSPLEEGEEESGYRGEWGEQHQRVTKEIKKWEGKEREGKKGELYCESTELRGRNSTGVE